MEHDDTAQQIMQDFAVSTGLSAATTEPRRYLWTDAFAVCNYLGLFNTTGDQVYLDLATRLVAQVHEHLGKHRKDSKSTGWLSGLPEEEARSHPTCAGLRIGKPLDERKVNESPDEALEWQQDGQYFHYLTRWMHALNCVALQTRNPDFNRWATELAKTAHRAFVYSPEPGGPKRMYWKMSIDLSRPLVTSMGHHDPLDGMVTYQQLQATAAQLADSPTRSVAGVLLKSQVEDLGAMCAGRHWTTSDELGIGCMLISACHVAQLVASGSVPDEGLLELLLSDSVSSLRAFAPGKRFSYPAEHRLGFREFGLAIGLRAVANIEQTLGSQPQPFRNPHRLFTIIELLQEFCDIHQTIVDFWLAPPNRAVRSWLDHADINNVMLATSLAPDAYLGAQG
jgi:hypothetical protein